MCAVLLSRRCIRLASVRDQLRGASENRLFAAPTCREAKDHPDPVARRMRRSRQLSPYSLRLQRRRSAARYSGFADEAETAVSLPRCDLVSRRSRQPARILDRSGRAPTRSRPRQTARRDIPALRYLRNLLLVPDSFLSFVRLAALS